MNVASFMGAVSLSWLSFLAGLWIGDDHYQSKYEISSKRIECEAALPRNQECEVVVTAVPSKVEENNQ